MDIKHFRDESELGNPMGMGIATVISWQWELGEWKVYIFPPVFDFEAYYKLLQKSCYYDSSCSLDSACFNSVCVFFEVLESSLRL